MNSLLLLFLILAAAVIAMCLIAGVRARRTEAMLRRQNILLDGALNNMSQGLNMFDRENRLVVSNKRYIEMYRLPPGAVKPGVTVRELVDMRLAAGTFFKTDPDQYVHELVTSMVERRPTRMALELADGRVVTVVNQPMDDGGWVVTH